MAIPNEALQKIIREIETQAVVAQEQMSVVKAQIASKQRDVRLLQLTTDEVKGLPADTNVYEGVGKMFVFRPQTDVKQRLSRDTTELRSDIANLEKKLHYFETTFKNSRQHMDQIIRSGGGRS
ncbi:MAG: hypothetical protein M1823_000753 [Watsoniomyces obsoletus]|nr:MAG: hypothetical protein M1823_000753 [Watsoniomyces obsoletus]